MRELTAQTIEIQGSEAPEKFADGQLAHVRILEALLFAASQPLAEADLARHLPPGTNLNALLRDLQATYQPRGVNLLRVNGCWMMRTAGDLSWLLRKDVVEQKRLSRAGLETLAIVAYHQPVTRAEIEDVRGVAISKGTLDALVDMGWVRMRGRRRTPGRPVTYGTTEAFLIHFGLSEVTDLPGLQELKAAGLLDATLPVDFEVPMPRAGESLLPDEDPLDSPDEAEAPLEMHQAEPSDEEASLENEPDTEQSETVAPRHDDTGTDGSQVR